MVGISDREYWYEMTPRKLFAIVSEWKAIETEKAITNAVAQRIKDPYDLREKEEEPALTNDQLWDRMTRGT